MNLKNYDVDKVDNLPPRQRMREFVTTGLHVKHIGWNMRNEYRYRYNSKISKAYNIFKGSVNKPFAPTRKKLEALMHPSFSYHYWLDTDLVIIKGEFYHQQRGHKAYDSYFIDSNDMLRKTPPRNWKYSKTPQHLIEEARIARAERKAREEIVNVTLLKMINNPDLFQFYKAQLLLVRELTDKMNPKDIPSHFRKDTWYYSYLLLKQRKDKSIAQSKYMYAKGILNSLEAGDYTPYFHKRIGLLKPCHHFNQP